MEKIIFLFCFVISLSLAAQTPVVIKDSTGNKIWQFSDAQTQQIVKELKKSGLKDSKIKEYQKTTEILSKSLSQCQLNALTQDSIVSALTTSNDLCDSSIVLLKQSQKDLTAEVTKLNKNYKKEYTIRKTYEKIGIPVGAVLIIVLAIFIVI